MSVTFISPSDLTQRWRSLSDVPPDCNYQIMAAPDPGVVFYSPLPACQSETKVRPCGLLSTDNGCNSLAVLLIESETLLIQISSAVFVGTCTDGSRATDSTS